MLKFDNVKSSNASKPHAKDAKEDDEKEEVVVVVDGQTFLLLFFSLPVIAECNGWKRLLEVEMVASGCRIKDTLFSLANYTLPPLATVRYASLYFEKTQDTRLRN